MFCSIFFWHMISICEHICAYICIQTYICIHRERENMGFFFAFLLLHHSLHDFFPLVLPLSPAKSRPCGKICTGLPAILTFQII